MDYYGQDVGSQANVGDAFQCQRLCARNWRCRFFTYGEPNHPEWDVRRKCHFKSGRTGKAVQGQLTSGPKYC